MLAVHVYILALWVLLWVVFYGWGTLACRVSRCDRNDAAALLINPWIGIACVLGVLQIWHFFAPVNTWACGLVCVGGILGAAIFGFRRLALIGAAARRSPLVATLIALCALWLVNRSLHPPLYTDHGLYYLNTIRWASDYPIVPGLANLHNRLGFNNSNFLLHAMLEVMTGRGHSAHVLNGLIAALSVPIVIHGFRGVFQGTADERQAGWFTLALAMVVSSAAVDGRIYSATPDFPATVFVTIAAWRLLVLSIIEPESSDANLRWNLLSIAMLATAAVTMKLFAILFAGLALVALVATLYRLNGRRSPRPLLATARSLVFTAMWPILLFVPWAARGYVLSGYPLFPSTILAAPVDWKFDAEAAADLREVIRAWSRTYHTNFEVGYEPVSVWLPQWIVEVALLRAPVEVVVPTLIALAAILWLAWCMFTRPQLDNVPLDSDSAKRHASSSLAWFSAWLLAGAYCGTIALWFITAPSPRFGSFALWGLAAICLGMVSRTLPADWMTRHQRLIAVALAALLLLPMADEVARAEFRHRHKPEHFMYGKHFYHYYPIVWPAGENGFPPGPKGNLVEMKTKSGLIVYVGAPQPNGYPDLLWDSPLPAARFFNPNLALRRPGDMRSGFKTLPPDDKPNN